MPSTLHKSQDQISDLSGVFNGWGSTINSDYDWQKWESKLPSLQTVNFFELDPAYESKFGLGDVGESIVRELGIYSITSAMRNCMTRIATAWGWFQNALGAIKTVFKERIDTIANALETVQEVMSNISIAVNSISWIPIFGWIVKIIFEIAKIITKIIAAVKKAQEKRDKKALSENAKAFALPIAKWDPDIDTMMCQYMQRQLSAGVFDLEWCFMPRYPAKNASDFVAQHQKYNNDDECFSGWLICSNHFKNKDPNVEPPGLGFVAGTMNIHAAVTLMTRAGGDVRDMGDFFPISRSLAANLWGQTVKGDSGMTFAIDTDKCINAWTDYISSAYGYGLDGIRGWSMIAGQINKSTPLSYTNARGPIEYKCSSCDHGAKGCTAGRDKGRWRTPAGKGHKDSYLAHIHQMFGWGEYGRQDDWWETATPVIALRNLRE